MAGTTARMTAAQAARYDEQMRRLERRFFPDTRAWVCQRAHGDTLEVAIGTGLNLSHYPSGVRLTGVDHNRHTLDLTRDRARKLRRELSLTLGDAAAPPFPDAVFDTVVATFVLCEVPDEAAALGEALRVLRPGGDLLLADHVVASLWPVRLGQHLLEAITVPMTGERFTRRPSTHLATMGAEILAIDRFAGGALERVHARKP